MRYEENLLSKEIRKIPEVGDVFYFKTAQKYGTIIEKVSNRLLSGYRVQIKDGNTFVVGRTALLRDAEFVGASE